MKIKKDKILTIPNIITVFRFMIIPFLFWVWFDKALISDEIARVLLLVFLFVIASVSDLIDGYWARRYKEKSKIGAFLDPLVDKIFTLSIFLAYLWIDIIHVWWGFVAIIIFREVFITLMRVVASLKKKVMVTESHGKVKMLTQVIIQSIVWLFVLLYGITYHMKIFKDFLVTTNNSQEYLYDLPFQIFRDFYINILGIESYWVSFLFNAPNFLVGLSALVTVYSGIKYLLINRQSQEV